MEINTTDIMGRDIRCSINQFVEMELNDIDVFMEADKIIEFLGNLSNHLVKEGIMSPEKLSEMLCGVNKIK